MALTMKDLAEKDKRVSLMWAANANSSPDGVGERIEEKG